MSGPSQRPQYGEYATEDQQRAAIKDPAQNPHYAPPEPEAQPEHDYPTPSYASQPGDPRQQQRASAFLRHPVDRVITIALLVIGLYNVIGAITERTTLAADLTSAFHSLGVSGDYTATALTSTVGIVIAIAYLVLWAIGAVLAVWNITRGRISFWIPLVAGLLAILVRAVGYAVLLAHDPAFLHYVQTMS